MTQKTSAVALFLIVLSAVTFAQSNSGPATGPFKPASSVPGKTPILPAGTDKFAVTIGAWDMQPSIAGAETAEAAINGAPFLRYSTSDIGASTLVGHLHLPAGALIDSFEVDACDIDPLVDLPNVLFYDCDDSGGGPGPCTLIDTISPPTGQPGCYFALGKEPLNYTIQDNANHDYIFTAFLLDTSLVGLRGVKVHYSLQVSPAPPVPTFTDVPKSDPAYQFIEALVQSGITVGCGDGKYCPDSFLTRRQMAVYLAVALGLRWPE
jgi:hypothetical protein